MFERCCENRDLINYEIVHNPQPILLSSKMDIIIKELLWYVPNIDSYQALKNELISDKVYDDFAFTYIMKQMNMVEDHDVKWIDSKDSFDGSDWHYYENCICKNCQKIIITRQKNLSKTNDLLRCLRNCIAHGHFTIVDDYIIGFNKISVNRNSDERKKAVIKIKPELLLSALKSLTSPMAKEILLEYAFKRIGYTVQRSDAQFFDLIVEKNAKKHVIEIKEFKGIPYLHPKDLEKFLLLSKKAWPEAERVLFIDTSRVTKTVREQEREIENFRIVDLTQVKQLLQDNPVDILAETL